MSDLSELTTEMIEDLAFVHFLCCVVGCDRCPIINKCFDFAKAKGFKNLKEWLESECEE